MLLIIKGKGFLCHKVGVILRMLMFFLIEVKCIKQKKPIEAIFKRINSSVPLSGSTVTQPLSAAASSHTEPVSLLHCPSQQQNNAARMHTGAGPREVPSAQE